MHTRKHRHTRVHKQETTETHFYRNPQSEEFQYGAIVKCNKTFLFARKQEHKKTKMQTETHKQIDENTELGHTFFSRPKPNSNVSTSTAPAIPRKHARTQ